MHDENDRRTPSPDGEEPKHPPTGDPAKGHKPGRRQFLKAVFLAAGAAGAAAYMKPTFAATSAGSDLANDSPMPLPFHFDGEVPGGPFHGTVEFVELPELADYEFRGSALMSIDADGNVALRGALLTGLDVNGSDVGTVTLKQVHPVSLGRYDGSLLRIFESPFEVSNLDGEVLILHGSAEGLLSADRADLLLTFRSDSDGSAFFRIKGIKIKITINITINC